MLRVTFCTNDWQTPSSKLPEEIQQLVVELKKDNPCRSLNTLLELVKRQGKGKLARSSVYRLLKQHNLSKRSASDTEVIERRAFEALSAGDIWYGDVMHGPSIQTPQGKQKTYLVSVMDDASRLICDSAFCLNETALSIEYVLKQAILKRGLPKRLVIDNGPAYRADTLQNICARLGIRLIYCRPYEPEGKGKLERYHRTFREQFLTEVDIKSFNNLDELNTKLWIWVERIYHRTVHSALHETPIARFQRDLLKIRSADRLNLNEYFYHRVKRFIRKDGTLSYNDQLYEVSFDYVGQNVYLVIDPHQQQAKWIESLEYERLGPVHPLDKHANLNRKRKRPKLPNTEQKPKTYLVDVAYQQSAELLNLIKETK